MTDVLGREDRQAHDWVVCAGCGEMVYRRRLERAGKVCPECNHHLRLTARERVDQLFDPGSVEELPVRVWSTDVLGFTDTMSYADRLTAARRRTGLEEGVVAVRGTVTGRRLVAAVMDFGFLGGSLGAGVGELITQAAEAALRDRVPLLLVSASGGARMQEGAISLMQMAKTAQALARLDEAGILTVSLITDPTYGGVAASFSTLCDVLVAEPGARLGFAGPRVIRQTIRQELPPRFQTAEFLLEHGLVDLIRPRTELRATLGRLLAAGAAAHNPLRSVASTVRPTPAVLTRDPRLLPPADAWDAVRRARDLSRPTLTDYLNRVFEDFEELHGDRLGQDCPAVVGGIATFEGRPVMVIGHHKGATIAELTARHYGMPSPAGYRKAVRLMRLAAKLRLPVVTFVDTPGAHPGIEAEEHGQAVAIAESIQVMGELPVPVITVVTGEGGSGGALALAVADEVLIWSNGVYSVISPEGCAAILWQSPEHAPTAAELLRLDARRLLELGIVDGVIHEPDGGTGADHGEAAERMRAVLASSLEALSTTDAATLVARRHARFRAYGAEVLVREGDGTAHRGAREDAWDREEAS